MVQPTTFRTAFPYALGTAGIALAGTAIAVTATGTAGAVAGVFMAIFGAYSFFGVVACGLHHEGQPQLFKKNVGKFVMTAAAATFTDIISTVAKIVLVDLIRSFMNGRRRAY